MFKLNKITPSAKLLQNFIPTQEFDECTVLDIVFVNTENGEEEYFERFYTFNTKGQDLANAVVERIRFMPSFIERSSEQPPKIEQLNKYLLRIVGSVEPKDKSVTDEDYLLATQVHVYQGQEVFEILMDVEGELGFPVSSPFKSLYEQV